MLRKSSKYPRQRVFCVSHTQKLKYTETSKFGHSYKVGIIIIHTFGEVSVKLKSSCNIRHQQLVEASGEREREREREEREMRANHFHQYLLSEPLYSEKRNPRWSIFFLPLNHLSVSTIKERLLTYQQSFPRQLSRAQ